MEAAESLTDVDDDEDDSPAVDGITSSSMSKCSVRFNNTANKMDDNNADDNNKQLRRRKRYGVIA